MPMLHWLIRQMGTKDAINQATELNVLNFKTLQIISNCFHIKKKKGLRSQIRRIMVFVKNYTII